MNNNKSTVLHVWMLPLLFVIGCLALNYVAGSLNLRHIIDERSQRDFNAALGMPLMIGYLWLALRVLHRRSAKRIADFLVQVNRVAEYPVHMKHLEQILLRQVIVAATLSITLTLIYLLVEDLLAVGQSTAVLLLNMIAVPFWFFIILFIMQSASFTRYLYTRLVLPNIENCFHHCKPICDLGLSNVMFSLLMNLLLPVFWIGLDIPSIDLLIIAVMIITLTALLFWPVMKTVRLMRRYRNNSINSLESQIEHLIKASRSINQTTALAGTLNALNQQLDELKQYRCWPKDVAQNIQVFAVSAGIPCLCLVFTWIVL